MLNDLVVPEHLQGLFQIQLAKLRESDQARSHAAAAEPEPGDAYPPRATAQHHSLMNFCVMTRSSSVSLYSDGVGVGANDSASGFVPSLATVAIEFDSDGCDGDVVDAPFAYEYSSSADYSMPDLLSHTDSDGEV